jgi:putative endonuclease
MNKAFYIYILANQKHGTLYIGMTNNLVRRVYEHKSGLVKGFTQKYKLHRLVYFEICDAALAAIQREKTLKKWPREWKLNAIERENPNWQDLYSSLL